MATDIARMPAAGAHGFQSERARPGPWPWLALGLSLALTGYLFHDSIQSTVDTWLTSPEYNYGPLVPVIAALMLWRDLGRIDAHADTRSGGWLGVAIAFLGLLFGLIEFLSQTRFPGQLGLFLTVVGILVAWLGERRAAKVWPALLFLFFALPQAGVLQVALTSGLQLVSSIGAVAVIRMFDIPVLREGNIIDLGPDPAAGGGSLQRPALSVPARDLRVPVRLSLCRPSGEEGGHLPLQHPDHHPDEHHPHRRDRVAGGAVRRRRGGGLLPLLRGLGRLSACAWRCCSWK